MNTKRELAGALSDQSGLGIRQCEQMLTALAAVITETLAAGGEVSIHGVGKLAVKTRPAHDARNPRTGETVRVPERRAAAFSASATLKKAIN